MKYKKSFSFIFYSLTLAIYLYLFKQSHTNYSLILFAFTFLLLRKNLFKKLHYIESKLFFLTSLLIYQTVSPALINDSLTTIQWFIISRRTLSLSLLLFLTCFILFLIYQDILHLSYIDPISLASTPIKLFKEKKDEYITLYDNSRTMLNHKNIKYFVTEIPRHGYIRYTNQYNLPDKFFQQSTEAIEQNELLYIVLSKTGSPASEVISLFTHKNFNHLSLSFDRELKTMISYNGGNEQQKPGLNTEGLSSLLQKEDSHVLVYSLQATKAQQQIILKQIKKINTEGSAYNVIGLLTQHSIRPNMMFCSQFVYSMLQVADLNFFKTPHGEVKPTDFIEKDTQHKLTFEYEITQQNILHGKIHSL